MLTWFRWPDHLRTRQVPYLPTQGSQFHVHFMATWPYLCAMTAHSKPFVVTRNKCIAPKQRCIERLTAWYAVREFRDDPQGRYWYVVTALEVSAGVGGIRVSRKAES